MLKNKTVTSQTATSIFADFGILFILLSSTTVFKELDSSGSKIKFTLALIMIAYIFIHRLKVFYCCIRESDLIEQEKKKSKLLVIIYLSLIILFTISPIITGWIV